MSKRTLESFNNDEYSDPFYQSKLKRSKPPRKVVIILDSSIGTIHSYMMKKKLEDQQKGCLKWLERKLEYIYAKSEYKEHPTPPDTPPAHLPIEFINDRETVFSTRSEGVLRNYFENSIEIPAAWKADAGFMCLYGRKHMAGGREKQVFESLVSAGFVNKSAIMNSLKYGSISPDFVIERFGSDKEIVINCLRLRCDTTTALNSLSEQLVCDVDVIVEMLKSAPETRRDKQPDSEIFAIISSRFPHLLRDDGFIVEIILRHPKVCRFLSKYGVSESTILKALRMETHVYHNLPEHLKNDKSSILSTPDTDEIYCDLPECLKFDRDILLKVLLTNKSIYHTLPNHLKTDIDIIITIARSHDLMLTDRDEGDVYHDGTLGFFGRIHCDESSVIRLIHSGCLSFSAVPEHLLKDESILLEMARNTYDSFNIVPNCFVERRDLLLLNARKYYRCVSETIRKQRIGNDAVYHISEIDNHLMSVHEDPSIAFGSVLNDSYTIEKLDRMFQENDQEEIECKRRAVLEAVTTYPAIAEWIPKELREDREIITAVALGNPTKIPLFGTTLLHDMDLAFTIASFGGTIIRYFPKELRSNRELAMVALKQSGHAFRYLNDDLREDVEMALYAINQAKSHVDNMPPSLMEDESVLLELVKYTKEPLFGLFGKLANNRDFIRSAVSVKPYAVRGMDRSLLDDIEFVQSLIEQSPGVYYYLPQDYQHREDILLFAAKKRCVSRVNTEFITTPIRETVFKLLQTNGNILYRLDENYQSNRELALVSAKSGGAYFLYDGTFDDRFLKELYSIRMDSEYYGCYIPCNPPILE
jgi:hypothetical protein